MCYNGNYYYCLGRVGQMAVDIPIRYLLPFVLALHFFLQPAIARTVQITDVRFWSAPDHTRVVFDLSDSMDVETFSQESSSQFKLELKGVALPWRKREVQADTPFLKSVALTDLGKGRANIVCYQKRPLTVSVFYLKPYLDKPHRLVIDLVDPAQEKREQEERLRQKETRPKGSRIVVVDPGHGGEDPGAIGPSRTMEKEIVLRIGEKVVHLLRQQPDMKVFLTRKGDYFVPLEGRLKIARDYGTDLFVSLHTDGSFNPQARGSSVYCLSLSGATDEAAKILADKENMSNILGGALSKPAVAKDPNLNQILLDLMQNNSMKESVRFAELLLEQMREINYLKYRSYRQANFIVLRAPDIPSTLFEIAYVTNKDDERLLCQSSFQDKVARNVVNTVTRFFKQ